MSAIAYRITRALGAGTLGHVLTIAGRLAVIPLFLTAWGAQRYGEWLILSAAASAITLADVGGQIYYVNRVTELWARGDRRAASVYLSTGLAVFSLLAVCVLIPVTTVVLLGPVQFWLGLVTTDVWEVRAALLILAFHWGVSMTFGLLVGVYRAAGETATSIMYGNLVLATQIAASVVVLLTGGGVVPMAAVQVIPVLGVTAWVVHDLQRRHLNAPVFSFTDFDLSVARNSFAPSMGFAGIQASQIMVTQGTILIIGTHLGALEAATFSTLRTLSNFARGLIGLLAHSAWPEFTRLNATKDNRFELLFAIVFRLSMLAAIGFLVTMQFVGSVATEVWLRGQLEYSHNEMILFLAYTALTVLWTQYANALMASNLHTVYARWQVVISVVTLIFFVIGLLHYGLAGAIVAMIASEALLLLVLTVSLVRRHELLPATRSTILEPVVFVGLIVISILNAFLGIIVTFALVCYSVSGIRKISHHQREVA